MQRLVIAIVTLLIVNLCAFSLAAGENARRSFEEGKELFANGSYVEAAEKFRSAYDAKPTWKLLFNIAQAETAAKRYGLAIEAFESYLAEGGDEISTERNKEVLEEIQRLRFLVGVLQVDAPDRTEVIIDGVYRGNLPEAAKKRVAVGNHQVLLKLDGEVIVHTSVSISGGMSAIVSVDDKSSDEMVGAPQPSDGAGTSGENDGPQVVLINNIGDGEKTSSPVQREKNSYTGLLVSAVVTGVLGLGAVGIGIGFTAKGASDAQTRDSNATSYNATNDTTLAEAYKEAATNAQSDLEFDGKMLTVGYAVGGALLLTSTILLVVRSSKKNSETLTVRPTISGLSVQF